MFLHIGDTIVYRPCFGMMPPTTGKVTGLKYTTHRREKYGEKVARIHFDHVIDNRCLISLEGSTWIYSEQVCIDQTIDKLQEKRETLTGYFATV